MTTDFYLGCHMPRWMETAAVPLFLSAHTLNRYRRGGDPFPKARTRWALDSGGFTELSMHGRWTIDEDTWGGMVYRFMDESGCGWPPDFAAPLDMMCEPQILAKTGFTVRDHQEFTVDSVAYLRSEFPHAPWIPVLQGWVLDDYLTHSTMYAAAGIDLAAERLVGVGSVCRRQSTAEIGVILSTLAARGYRLHGFGVKTEGLRRYGHLLASADSMSWSYAARRDQTRLAGCVHRGTCQNCQRYALAWRQRVLAAVDAPKQLTLPFAAEEAA